MAVRRIAKSKKATALPLLLWLSPTLPPPLLLWLAPSHQLSQKRTHSPNRTTPQHNEPKTETETSRHRIGSHHAGTPRSFLFDMAVTWLVRFLRLDLDRLNQNTTNKHWTTPQTTMTQVVMPMAFRTTMSRSLVLALLSLYIIDGNAFVPADRPSFVATGKATGSQQQDLAPSHTLTSPSSSTTRTRTLALGLFNKLFEESGPLGKGITVGKVQVALSSTTRGPGTVFAQLEQSSRLGSSSRPSDLSRLANEVCLELLRKSDDWIGACSTSEWFRQDDAGKAESLFNDWANREASKFEKVC